MGRPKGRSRPLEASLRGVGAFPRVALAGIVSAMKICGRCRRAPVRALGQRWCLRCHAAHMRATRPKYRALPADAKRRANARSHANAYQGRGKLERQPCAQCGAPGQEKHHGDYGRPLDVTWLCRRHHLALHVPRETSGQP